MVGDCEDQGVDAPIVESYEPLQNHTGGKNDTDR